MTDDDAGSTAALIDFAAKAADRTLAQVEAKMSRDHAGRFMPTVANALWLFARVPNLQGMLAWNELSNSPLLTRAPPKIEDSEEMHGPYPRQWDKPDIIMVQSYFQRRWPSKWSRDTIEDAMLATAAQHRFHPVLDYLGGLTWDGNPRIDKWLTLAFGVPDDGTGYARSLAAKTLIAAVRRVRQPGCKFDHVLTVEGKQGIGKSRVIRALFGPDFYTDGLPADLANKDSALALLGKWGIEIAEVEQIIKNEPAVVKGFLSHQIDRYRPPYGKVSVDSPRQGIFVGRTNQDDYLRDTSGNRRFWPVIASFANIDWVLEYRDQLWAEAAKREAAGEAIWLDDEDVRRMAQEEQEQRVFVHPWTEKVLDWAYRNPGCTSAEALEGAILPDISRQTKAGAMIVAEILKEAGFIKRRDRRNSGKRPHCFYPP
jgi:putative DNA primase/helicase